MTEITIEKLAEISQDWHPHFFEAQDGFAQLAKVLRSAWFERDQLKSELERLGYRAFWVSSGMWG